VGLCDGCVGVDVDDFVVDVGVEDFGDEVCVEVLDFVWVWLVVVEDCGFGWFDGDDLYFRFFVFEYLVDVGDGVVGVDFGDDDVDGVVGVVLDFDGGCVVVYFGVGCVGELLG